MTKATMRDCYVCGAPATSDDHVPPRCLFPEQKDVGKDHRKQLVKVPACDAHNLRRSKDDEYLLSILPASAAANSLALQQYGTKVSRTLTHSPKLASMIVQGSASVNVDERRSLALNVDRARLERSLEATARGLLFHHAGTRPVGRVQVVQPLIHGSLEATAVAEDLELHAQLFGAVAQLAGATGAQWLGENEEVFRYRVVTPPASVVASTPGSIEHAVDMIFYQGVPVVVLFWPPERVAPTGPATQH